MYGFMLADCIACGQVFASNPHLVPCVRVRHRTAADPPGPSLIQDDSAPKQPLCRDCAERINQVRIETCGLDGWQIPAGAYESFVDD